MSGPVRWILFPLLFSLATGGIVAAQDQPAEEPAGLRPPFHWALSEPLVRPFSRPADPCTSIKDPTVVLHDGQLHLFCTIRSEKRSHQIEYLAFDDWQRADAAPRHILTLSDGYFCAPQVFYFAPHKLWYLVYQVNEKGHRQGLQPAFSTTADLAKPDSWTRPKLMFTTDPETVKSWIDFWVICDDTHARMFFTSNDGRMWRSDAPIADFPMGWNEPTVVLRGDVFEASHTYRVKETGRYLTIIEAIGHGRRYYKAYDSDRLDGSWTPVADSWEKPFASSENLLPGARPRWTDHVSHGELLRLGSDQRMEISGNNLQFLIQGVPDDDYRGRKYGEIPWRLGLLRQRVLDKSPD